MSRSWDKAENERTIDIPSNDGSILKFMDIDDRIRERMNAIVIAARLIERKSFPEAYLYTDRLTNLRWKYTHYKNIDLIRHFNDVAYWFEAESPTFVWTFKLNQFSSENIIISFKDNYKNVNGGYKLNYIKKVTYARIPSKFSYELLENDITVDECVEYLDKIIGSL